VVVTRVEELANQVAGSSSRAVICAFAEGGLVGGSLHFTDGMGWDEMGWFNRVLLHSWVAICSALLCSALLQRGIHANTSIRFVLFFGSRHRLDYSTVSIHAFTANSGFVSTYTSGPS
jgi:hypothetical protein